MKLKLKRCFLLAAIILLVNRAECLFIIPSMLMAMTGGLLMGKMTMGGLLMMLMAANNQQQNGQNFLRNLGLVPHPSPSTGISVPSSTDGFVQDLIVRRRRDVTMVNGSVVGDNSFKSGTGHGFIDEVTQYRIMRQVASSDPLGCLPSAICGISAAPPSSQSGFLNDYAYLLKTVFSREDDLDDDLTEFDTLKTTKKKKTTKTKSTTKKPTEKKKNKDQNDDESDIGESSEEEEVDEEDIDSQRRKDAIEMNEMANEEILTNDPDYIPYAMRDSLKNLGVGTYHLPPTEPEEPPQPPEGPYHDLPSGDINHMTEAQLDEMLYKLGGPPSSPPPLERPGSMLSKILPQLSLGFSGKGTDSHKFDDDPFFAGFKRGMEGRRLEVDKASVRPATREEEELFEELRVKRRMRREYILKKRKELAEIKDPVEKFRIAAEFGQKLKSPRQCRVLFNNCPFNYTQVLGMVSDLRNVIMGQPMSTAQQTDTVVNLKPAATPQPPTPNTGSKNVINLNAGSVSSGGITSIIHQLPTGEKVEINLKMTKSGLSATRKTKLRPGAANSTLTSVSTSSKDSKTKNQTYSNSNEASSGFDDDDQDNEENTNSSTPPGHSIESLKATMMAIQKINNATIHRKKHHRRPVAHTHISTLQNTPQKQDNASISEDDNVGDVKLPEPDPIILTKLQSQNNKPKKNSNNPQKTAALLASLPNLSKVTEDDEADDTLPTSLIGIKRKTSTGPKTNQELAEILARLKATKKGIDAEKGKKNVSGDISDDEEEEDEDEGEYLGDDDEEDETDDLNKVFKSDSAREEMDSGRNWGRNNNRPVPGHMLRKRSGEMDGHRFYRSPILRHVNLRQNVNVRKPKKLFLGHDIRLPRPLPL